MSRFNPADHQVLVVEDDNNLANLLLDEVRDGGYEVQRAASAEVALQLLQESSFDLVISDLRLPGMHGLELLQQLRTLHAPPACIVITAFGTISQAVEALRAGADDFLTKPLDLEHLMLCVERTLQNRLLRFEVRRFREMIRQDSFHGIMGGSRSMRILFDQIRQLARAQGPVLITGESGVGKELVARAIHKESDRCEGPFVAINCAGIPESLLESEFFGHAAGAFTGAQQRRKGLISDADGGTLLLDEIGEMPMTLQAKLLRVIQDSTLRPVGSNKEEQVDVRILAATNRNLEKDVQSGSFREDLFYRLETFALHIPPLRERGDDMELLANTFLQQINARMEKNIEGISEDALLHMRHYSFPGNVRELQNAMERAVTFCQEKTIQTCHLPARIREHAEVFHKESMHHPGHWPSPLVTLDVLELRYIQHVLEQVNGNKQRAAEILDIGRRTLYRKLEGMDSS
ncbi:sigma-54-dependent transcriptional regulator [Desulfurispira natronophila]|uniref:DNA-binding NtrC family response regulator n=1 Tax=Desulfurispira natronophila TaxID=682562 RepID=A0A7W7Y5P7_9BACT|nr:sigma-54 dependent transcriptional regulator [Desulfurispira natronophila]MBB5022462.1 DNA-binding NtrC family response regulator [Desulfurispira natronophila]